MLWSLTPRELEYLRKHRETELKNDTYHAKLSGYLAGVAFASAWGGKLGDLHRSLFPPIIEDDKTGEKREANKLDEWKAAVDEFKLKGIPGPWDEPGWDIEAAWGGYL